ncbi:hypothetical protein GQ600_25461 [Phytophthora cactorum]|nr:hypothetical protein GQ600_25461 [Phytophthora cactorum]
MQSIDYNSIRQTLDRRLSSGIPLERAWQTEFHKAAYCCVPSTFVLSADHLLGIELLREASNLAEHIDRFSPSGRYCLIDVRRVDSIDNKVEERIAADMRLCGKLFVLCYDAQMTSFTMFYSSSRVVYKFQQQSDTQRHDPAKLEEHLIVVEPRIPSHRRYHDIEHKAAQRRVDQEEQEELFVVPGHTVARPGAVVVHAVNASLTY